jgi:nicotinamide-nucleotide amidase
MEYLIHQKVIPFLKQRFDLHGVIKSRTIHTAGAGESQIDDLIQDLEELSNPTVGLAAHSGQVDIRITVKADSDMHADELIQPIESTIRERLGDWVYGADAETLEDAALGNINRKGWSLAVIEAGLGGHLIRRLAGAKGSFLGGEMLNEPPSQPELDGVTASFRQSRHADIGLGVAIYPAGERQDVYLTLITPHGEQHYTRPYGGPAENASRWALHHSLDIIRNL